jgi:hypothetical protein
MLLTYSGAYREANKTLLEKPSKHWPANKEAWSASQESKRFYKDILDFKKL